MTGMQSPWWYRSRMWVIAAIYFAGFTVGWLVPGLVHRPNVPEFVLLGARWGDAGIEAFFGLAIACFAAAYALRVWGSSYLNGSTVFSADAISRRFVDAGPFRFTRNPLYLGNVLMALAFGFFVSPAGFGAIVIGNLLFVELLIRWEESIMRSAFGERYLEYCARVPQLVPRLTPSVQTSKAKPSLREGLRTEVLVGCLFAGLLAWLLWPQKGWGIFLVLYIVGVLVQRRLAAVAERAR